jgi:hypothetical protein
MEVPRKRKKRGLSSVDARLIRQRGHNDAQEFATAIGMRSYENDQKAKKDVIDPSGDAHSVKGGEKKWQIFLYSLRRFQEDDAWAVMNGIGTLLANCIEAFPPNFDDYVRNKQTGKENLRQYMVQLAEKLQNKMRLRAFLNKSLFNGGEVDYLTVKYRGMFHIFFNKDVLDALCDNLEVCNSRTISEGNVPEQKVLLKYKGVNLGEIEMRNDSIVHYREIRFNMIKPRIMSLLYEKIPMTKRYSHLVLIYGYASRRFGRWEQ